VTGASSATMPPPSSRSMSWSGGRAVADGLKLLNHGLSYNGKPLPPAKVSWQSETRLRFALKGVLPGQIAHMCKAAAAGAVHETAAHRAHVAGQTATGAMALFAAV